MGELREAVRGCCQRVGCLHCRPSPELTPPPPFGHLPHPASLRYAGQGRVKVSGVVKINLDSACVPFYVSSDSAGKEGTMSRMCLHCRNCVQRLRRLVYIPSLSGSRWDDPRILRSERLQWLRGPGPNLHTCKTRVQRGGSGFGPGTSTPDKVTVEPGFAKSKPEAKTAASQTRCAGDVLHAACRASAHFLTTQKTGLSTGQEPRRGLTPPLSLLYTHRLKIML
jgi:hypothetical protein